MNLLENLFFGVQGLFVTCGWAFVVVLIGLALGHLVLYLIKKGEK